MRTVASPANSISTSCPISRKATAQTNGKLARVGFSEPDNENMKNFWFSAALAGGLNSTVLAATAPAQKCPPSFRNDRLLAMRTPPVNLNCCGLQQ
jgi:hypothetical protein